MTGQCVLTVGLPQPMLMELLEQVSTTDCQIVSAMSLADARWIALHRSFRVIVIDMSHVDYQDMPAFTEVLAGKEGIRMIALNEQITLKSSQVENVIHLRSDSPVKIAELVCSLLANKAAYD